MKIALIPAREGSKLIKHKNVRPLCGRPLIAWTIEAALASKAFDQVYVSTDDPRVRKVARSFGPAVHIHNRSAHAATDTATTYAVIWDFFEATHVEDEDIITVLQPTSPLRTASDCARAARVFTRPPQPESLVSVCPYLLTPTYAFKIAEKGWLKPRFPTEFPRKGGQRRQDFPPHFYPNGAIYMATARTLRERQSFITPRIRPFIMDRWRSIDIDTRSDFAVAELLLGAILEKGERPFLDPRNDPRDQREANKP